MNERPLSPPAQGRETRPVAEGLALKVLYVVNEDWMFWSHRLSLARAVRDAGGTVLVATRVSAHGERIAGEGFRVFPVGWRRGARNPARELGAVASLARIYRRERPDIVHHVGIKSAVYGGFASLLARQRPHVNTLAGFGYVSTSKQTRARLLRPFLRLALRRVLNRPGSHLVVQNPDDQADVVDGGLFDPARVHLVRGSGVDAHSLRPLPEPPGPVTAALLSRLVRSKGVVEFARAGRILARRNSGIRMVLVGDPDPENHESVTHEELRRWVGEGIVEHLPYVEDVRGVWERAHIAVLPSYREGLPRALLEAAACGRALVAADVPGCREIVRQEENGLLVPARDPRGLAEAIERLAADPDLRARMGARSRQLVETTYADDIVVGEMLSLYRSVARAGGGAT